MKRVYLFPQTQRLLSDLGHNLKLARLRRKYTTVQVSERAGITRATLQKIESGDPGTSMGLYFSVLHVLGLQSDMSLVARDDILGRKLQDIELLNRKTLKLDKESSKSIGKTNATVGFRRAKLLGAVPNNLTVGEIQKIEELYEQAAELTNKTGKSHHVDHIKALCGPDNGFHILENLQILPAIVNLKKSNKK